MVKVDQLVKSMLNRSSFPFTGAQLALIAVIAVVLIAGGDFNSSPMAWEGLGRFVWKASFHDAHHHSARTHPCRRPWLLTYLRPV